MKQEEKRTANSNCDCSATKLRAESGRYSRIHYLKKNSQPTEVGWLNWSPMPSGDLYIGETVRIKPASETCKPVLFHGHGNRVTHFFAIRNMRPIGKLQCQRMLTWR